MFRHVAKAFGLVMASAVTAVIGIYVLMVVGSRRAVHYHYGA